MSDDKEKRGPADASWISLSEPYEAAYWIETLGVTRDELARAVVAVGNSVQAVRAYFQRDAS
jgi:hypothetical protein